MSLLYDKDSTDNTSPILEEKIYKVYFQRWLVLFAFSSFSFVNSFGFVQNSPILKLSAAYYKVDDNAVVWFSNVYYVTYIFFGMFGIRPLQLRLDYTLIVAALVNAVGCWLKYFADDQYLLALSGYVLLGLGQLVILAAPVYISDKWFPPHERTLATSIGSFINQIGLNFTFMFVTLYFKDVNTYEQNCEKQLNLNYMAAILNTVSLVLCVLFIRDAPKTPPSIASEIKKDTIYQSLKKIVSNRVYFLNLLSLSIFLGISWTYTSVLTVILDPYGYTQTQIGIIGLIFILSGTVGGSVASLVIDAQVGSGKIPKYDLLIKLFMTIGMIALIVQALIIDKVGMTVISISTAFIGIGLNSYFPIAVQSYVESLYPSFELVLITAMIIASNMIGMLGNYLLLFPVFQKIGLWILAACALPFYLYILFFYKTKLMRLEQEQKQLQIK